MADHNIIHLFSRCLKSKHVMPGLLPWQHSLYHNLWIFFLVGKEPFICCHNKHSPQKIHVLKTFYFPAKRSDPSCSNKVSYKCRYSELTCSPQSQQVQLFWSHLVQIEQQYQLRYSDRNMHEQQFKFDGCLKIYVVAVSDDLQCTKNNT